MQDAPAGSWTRESHWSPEYLDSLRDLNQRFLELAERRRDAWQRPAVMSLMTPLSGAQREAAASCPYALFDLRFDDHAHWQLRLSQCALQVADASPADAEAVPFMQLALFFAWHVASRGALAAHLLLGMSADTTQLFRNLTMKQLPLLALTETPYLKARWSECGAYWNALTEAAARTDNRGLRRVQLHGLQLAAAVHLPPV